MPRMQRSFSTVANERWCALARKEMRLGFGMVFFTSTIYYSSTCGEVPLQSPRNQK